MYIETNLWFHFETYGSIGRRFCIFCWLALSCHSVGEYICRFVVGLNKNPRFRVALRFHCDAEAFTLNNCDVSSWRDVEK